MKSQIPNSKLQKLGFTLLETIIYLAIVSVILVSISFLIIDIMGGQSKNEALQEVSYNVRIITDMLALDIHQAADIGSLTADSLTLTFSGDDVNYIFDSGSGTLTRTVGVFPAIVVNTNTVTAAGTFYDYSFTDRSQHIGVDLTVSHKNLDNLPDFEASTDVSFSAELRGRR